MRFPFRDWARFWAGLWPGRSASTQRLLDKIDVEFAERRAIEKELAHLASFPERDPNYIIETDVSGAVQYINPAALQRFPDLNQLKLNHPLLDGLPDFFDQMERQNCIAAKRHVQVGECTFQQWVSILADFGFVRIYSVDISDLKLLEQVKNNFVNTVSHELRSPLTSIQATIKMVEAGMLGAVSADQKDALGLALANISRLGRMVTNLLDIAKMEVGQFELTRRSVELKELTQNVAKTFQTLAAEKGIALRVEANAEQIEMRVDPDKIIQILTNLVSNALKFTQRGQVTLVLDNREDGVECSVKDTGPGIDPDDLRKVFGRFQQLNSPSTGGERGTGLGLALCKSLVELHQGYIGVDSELGRGTTFRFYLPRLSPTAFFYEALARWSADCLITNQPLSLLNLSIRSFPELKTRIGLERTRALMAEFETLISRFQGPHAKSFSMPQNVWLGMPGVTKPEAREILARIEEAFAAFEFQQVAQVPVQLDSQIISYPEDARMIDKLLPLMKP